MFFQIRYFFIDWMFKKHLMKYTFNMTDDRYPDYEFSITVERKKNNDTKN